MEHSRLFDWYSIEPDTCFVTESDVDNSAIEKIMRHKFHDPLLALVPSEEEDAPPIIIDWNKVFKQKARQADKYRRRRLIAGLRPLPPYPRLSSLSREQHMSGLRLLSAANPHVLHTEYIARPNGHDATLMEEIKETYEAEQKEYIEWAKALWINGQCIRALRPAPAIETVYEAKFNLKAAEMQSFPKNYELAAQICYEPKGECQLVPVKDLISIKVCDLPKMQWPELVSNKVTIFKPCPMPEPCSKHPTSIVLPNEKAKSVLPLTEVHRSLAQYAAENGAQVVASERALQCLVATGDAWALPVTLAQGITPDGVNSNVLVIGSELYPKREFARTRTYRAMRHLLEYALVPACETAEIQQRQVKGSQISDDTDANLLSTVEHMDDMEIGSDDEDQLVIDVPEIANDSESDEETTLEIVENNTKSDTPPLENYTNENINKNTPKENSNESHKKPTYEKSKQLENELQSSKKTSKNGDDFYSCTCKDSIFETPPPRSFRKWQLSNTTTDKHIDIIVYCTHKTRNSEGEVILEPIPEHQIELGASQEPGDRMRALALSLALRHNASVVSGRVDAVTGEVVSLSLRSREELSAQAYDVGSLHAALDQLAGLVPGHYLLKHEPNHGHNALLYAPNQLSDSLTLDFDSALPADETVSAKVPPVLTPTLLPMHKFHKILPLSFTPYPHQVARPSKKPPTKKKAPPQAIRWPKGKGKHSKKKRRANRQRQRT